MTTKKKNILNWNYISDKLTEDRINELKTLYRFYHKKYWIYKTIHTNLNRKHIASQVTSICLVVIGTIAGGVTLNPIILETVSGSGLLLKHFWN